MKTQELEKTSENGAKTVTKETQDIVLTDKQAEMLKQVMQEKAELQKLADEIGKREVVITTLIFDNNSIDDSEVASAQLSEDGSVLTITKKD